MPVKSLPPNASLNDLEQQATELAKAHAARDPEAAQRLREFHPRMRNASDGAIFDAPLRPRDAQLAIARERGFEDWQRLKRRIENPTRADDLNLPHHERIEDAAFRRAVNLLDAGDLDALRAHLSAHPQVVRQRVMFEGGNYFRNPSLLEFVAENPIRRGAMPANVVEIGKLILNSGAREDRQSLNETLGLVSSGRIARECRAQVPLIDLLCAHGADPDYAMPAALPHGEFEAVEALLRNGARLNLAAAAALGRSRDCERQMSNAGPEDRHRALALAAQFGRVELVRMLLDAGEDPNRYNPPGCHGHSTPLHQAALAGHLGVVRLLVERGARLDIKDTAWHATPAGWAEHESRKEVKEYLASVTGSRP